MKYSPKVNEALVRSHKVTHLHPWQDDATAQRGDVAPGADHLQRSPGWSARRSSPAAARRRCTPTRGSAVHCPGGARPGRPRRDHHDGLLAPVRTGAGPATAGFRLITLCDGLPSLDRQGRRCRPDGGPAAANPEEHRDLQPADRRDGRAQEAGGICHYDQANANGILGITRARDATSTCAAQLHKTFSSPHASMGMPVRVGVLAELAPFLPRPTVEFDGERYRLDDDSGARREGARVPRRAGHRHPLVRVGAGARRGGPARGGGDRGAEQQPRNRSGGRETSARAIFEPPALAAAAGARPARRARRGRRAGRPARRSATPRRRRARPTTGRAVDPSGVRSRRSTTASSNTTLARPRARRGSVVTSTPSSRAVPAVGRMVVVSMPTVVDLPAPFGPRRRLAGGDAELMPRTASTPPG